MKIVVVVQARMGSERFPGKVLADLNGEPMLLVMLKRLAPLERHGIDIVVATTELPEDDAIQTLCHDRGIYCYRGSSENVLSRYQDIAKDYDVIVRLTGDCPLVWAAHVLYVLERHDEHALGTYTACLQVDGLEVQVYERDALLALEDTTWNREHLGPPAGELHWVRLPSLSVDTPEDLERVRDLLCA